MVENLRMANRSSNRHGFLAALLTLVIIVGVTYLIARILISQGEHVPPDTTFSRTPAVVVPPG